jgi:signal transduction histidine kinase
MSLAGLGSRLGGRRSVRARVGLACGGLFFVTGAAFVAATYALVDHSLSSTVVAAPNKSLLMACSASEHNGGFTGGQAATCKRAFAVAARFGAAVQRTHALHELLMWSVTGLVAAAVVAGLSGWAIGGRVLVPLHKVMGAARRASQEHLDERIKLEGPHDELKQLADTFDEMLDRLNLAFASQRRFVANASHELRTPLTSMRTLIDVALAKPAKTIDGLEALIGRVREALGQSEAIIDGLLALARSDRGLTTRELVDLEPAAQDAIDQTSAAAGPYKVSIEADLSAAPALGDRALLERLVANLIDNAARYNVANGSVRVETGTHRGNGPAERCSYLSVTNTGPVVPPAKVTSLFEPFTRLDQRVANGQGVGLGLSIVASVAAAHGGQVQAEARPGGGLNVTVRFPTAEPWHYPGSVPGLERPEVLA